VPKTVKFVKALKHLSELFCLGHLYATGSVSFFLLTSCYGSFLRLVAKKLSHDDAWKSRKFSPCKDKTAAACSYKRLSAVVYIR